METDMDTEIDTEIDKDKEGEMDTDTHTDIDTDTDTDMVYLSTGYWGNIFKKTICCPALYNRASNTLPIFK
jgi:hypothetical protein